MKRRYQADADLNESIVRGVLRREPSIDFRTAVAAGLRSLPDHEVLMHAAAESRVLVSHDRKTMPRAFGDFIRAKPSPGLILISQKNRCSERNRVAPAYLDKHRSRRMGKPDCDDSPVIVSVVAPVRLAVRKIHSERSMPSVPGPSRRHSNIFRRKQSVPCLSAAKITAKPAHEQATRNFQALALNRRRGATGRLVHVSGALTEVCVRR